jgi:uncharacterized caspase-like protein
VLLQLGGCSAPKPAYPARLALVIGNAAYADLPALKNPSNDAADMCAALRRLNFLTLCHDDVRTRAEFEAHVQAYVQSLGPETVGVVFYSGHGVQAGGQNFLIPTQARLQAVAADPLRALYGLQDLFSALRQQPARFQLLILDACRTDLFAKAPPGATAPAAARSGLVRALQTNAGARAGLAPIQDAPAETLVLYATAAGDAAYDGQGRNGPLTQHVLQHLGDRGVTVEDFLNRVIQGVQTETGGRYQHRQTPYTYGSFGGRFCFAGCPGEVTVTPAF